MSEDDPAEIDDDRERITRVAETFAHRRTAIELDSGLVLRAANYTDACYAVEHPEEGTVDYVKVDQFKSARQLDEYLQRFEEDDHSGNAGVGVA